jgi:G3E family GTPase
VIGGYLGAGKTTLINACLQTRGERKIAVLVNDFGEINIDAALIESQTDTVLNLAGGCVCCSIGSDFMEALFELAALPQTFDHVLVETSGVALPRPIAQSIALSQSFEVDAIFVLADRETIAQHLQDAYVGDLVRQQLQQADCILVTKSDLNSPHKESMKAGSGLAKDPAEIETELATYMGGKVSGAVFALPSTAYSCEWLLGTSKLSYLKPIRGESATPEQSKWLRQPDGDPRYKVQRATSEQQTGDHDVFESLVIELDAPLDLPAVKSALLELAGGQTPMLIRAKGFVRDKANPRRLLLLQMVGPRLSLIELAAPQDQIIVPDPMMALVLIGLKRVMLSRQSDLVDFVTLLQS